MAHEKVSGNPEDQEKFNLLSYKYCSNMIIKSLKIFSQNIWKNKALTELILEKGINFKILFIQEPPWLVIHTILSSSNKEGDKVVGSSNYSNWMMFSSSSHNKHNYSKVVSYINIHLISMHFSLQKNVFNYKDICCFSFFLIIVQFSSWLMFIQMIIILL